MSLDEFGAPECQLRNCDADADVSREHPEYGDIQVCSTCASLFDKTGGSNE